MFYISVKVTLMVSMPKISSFLLLDILLLIQTSVMGLAVASLGHWFYYDYIIALSPQDLSQTKQTNETQHNTTQQNKTLCSLSLVLHLFILKCQPCHPFFHISPTPHEAFGKKVNFT